MAFNRNYELNVINYLAIKVASAYLLIYLMIRTLIKRISSYKIDII